MARKTAKKRVNLALQGGGAHGAFTWGVLDRLLEDERIEVEGISATSAGALNAAMLKTGLGLGGREGARKRLDEFWGRVEEWRGPLENPWLLYLNAIDVPLQTMAKAIAQAPAHQWLSTMTRTYSPYELNPFDINLMRDIIEDLIDFDHVCASKDPQLFISATNVRTGKIKVFEREEITGEALLASGCLPTLYRAVEIPDPKTGKLEAYWDGGYMGNPALYPLFYSTKCRDVLIVHINPIERDEVPKTAEEIQNRVNEISFNSSLLRELRTVHFVGRLIDEGKIREGDMMRVLIHSIADDDTMRQLGMATKLIPDKLVLKRLKEAGRKAMDKFLDEHFDDLDVCSTTDLPSLYN